MQPDTRGRSFEKLALVFPVYSSDFRFDKAAAIGHLTATARTCLAAEEAFAAQRL